MENFDTNSQVKRRRGDTFGKRPQASTPIKKPAPATPAGRKSLAKNVEKVKTNEESKVTESNSFNQLADKVKNAKASKSETDTADKKENQVNFVKGLQVGLTEDGFLRLVPFGETNYLDLVAMIDFAEGKKADIIAELAANKTHKTNKTLEDLTKHMQVLAEGVNTLLEKDSEG